MSRKKMLFLTFIFLFLTPACVPLVGNIQFGVETPTAPAPTHPAGEVTPLPTLEPAPGTYRAFAWGENFQLGGAYSAYVACGSAETCTDHSLQSFEVLAGQTVTDIDLCDWPFPAEQLPIPGPVSDSPSLDGLIYSTQEGLLFRLDANGNATALNSALGMVISPDGTSCKQNL
jgi:hypothetical protein